MTTRNKGSALAQLMIAVALTGGLALLVTSISKMSNKVERHASDSAVLGEIRGEAALISKDAGRWLSILRDPTVDDLMKPVTDCIPASGVTYLCPAVLTPITDPILLEKLNAGLRISTVQLVSATGSGARRGSPFAGTETSPRYLDSRGKDIASGILPTDPRSRFRSVGYMITQGSSGVSDPGFVEFIVKVERNPLVLSKDETPTPPLYLRFPVGTQWKQPTVSTTCAAGQIGGFDSAGAKLCFQAPLCAPGEYFIGWNTAPGTGNALCQTPEKSCIDTLAGVTLSMVGAQADGTLKCAAPKNDEYWAAPWSACSANCGGGTQSMTACVRPHPDWPATKLCSDIPAPTQACNTASCWGNWTCPGCGPGNLVRTCTTTQAGVCTAGQTESGAACNSKVNPIWWQAAWPPGGYYDGTTNALNPACPWIGPSVSVSQMRAIGGNLLTGQPVPPVPVLVNFAGHICQQPGYPAPAFGMCGWPGDHIE